MNARNQIESLESRTLFSTGPLSTPTERAISDQVIDMKARAGEESMSQTDSSDATSSQRGLIQQSASVRDFGSGATL